MRRLVIPITGDAMDSQFGPVHGLVHSIYADNGSGGTALEATTDITITEAETGAPILTITNLAADLRYQPRDDVHSIIGAVATQADERIPISGNLRVVVAQGGAGKVGSLHVYIAEEA